MQLDVQFDRRESTAGTQDPIDAAAVAAAFDRITAHVAELVDEPADPAIDLWVDEPIDEPVDVRVDEPVDDEPVGTSFARCADGNGTLTHLFFSDDEFDLARAKAICRRCGLAERCLVGALERIEPYGVWGGKLVVEGVIVEVKRGRGRPPKTPRPPLVVDEVPLPPHLVA